MAPAREAVDIYRLLSENPEDGSVPTLAGALQQLSNRISATGPHRRPAPGEGGREALRRAGHEAPGPLPGGAGRGHERLGRPIADTGDRTTPVPFGKQAVRLQRELVEEEQPDASVPALVEYLLNYARHLAAAGEPVEAVPRAEEAVGHLRSLAAEDPEAFRPRLAAALHALGGHRAAVSDVSGAVEAAQEACGVLRELSAHRPDACRPELATALDGLAGHLSRAGDPAEGRRAAEEAVALHREPAAQDRPGLAAALLTLARRLASTGDPVGALPPVREAVDLLRELGDAFLPELADSLQVLGTYVELNGDTEGAVEAFWEAVALHRALALERPGASATSVTALVSALDDLTRALVRTGEHAAAIDEFEETVKEFEDSRPGDRPAPARGAGHLPAALPRPVARERADRAGGVAGP